MSQDALLLRDILEAIDNILEFTAEGREAFLKDKRTQHAVIRNFEAWRAVERELRGLRENVERLLKTAG